VRLELANSPARLKYHGYRNKNETDCRLLGSEDAGFGRDRYVNEQGARIEQQLEIESPVVMTAQNLGLSLAPEE